METLKGIVAIILGIAVIVAAISASHAVMEACGVNNYLWNHKMARVMYMTGNCKDGSYR